MSPSAGRRPYAVVAEVTKRYVTRAGGVDALDAVSAAVPIGSTTALVGVSGSTLVVNLVGSFLLGLLTRAGVSASLREASGDFTSLRSGTATICVGLA